LYDTGDYVQALQTRQEKYSLEHEHGLRAFVGAGRIKSAAASPEIQISGRREDMDRVLKKIGSSDCRLLVVHGLSGVGVGSGQIRTHFPPETGPT
jgi:hypothetical protein